MKKKLKLTPVPHEGMVHSTYYKSSCLQNPVITNTLVTATNVTSYNSQNKCSLKSEPETIQDGKNRNFTFVPSDNSFKFNFGDNISSWKGVTSSGDNSCKNLSPSIEKNKEITKISSLQNHCSIENDQVNSSNREANSAENRVENISFDVDQKKTGKTEKLDMEVNINEKSVETDFNINAVIHSDSDKKCCTKSDIDSNIYETQVSADKDIENISCSKIQTEKDYLTFKFERELCWCIEQLELGLSKQNATPRQGIYTIIYVPKGKHLVKYILLKC